MTTIINEYLSSSPGPPPPLEVVVDVAAHVDAVAAVQVHDAPPDLALAVDLVAAGVPPVEGHQGVALLRRPVAEEHLPRAHVVGVAGDDDVLGGEDSKW